MIKKYTTFILATVVLVMIACKGKKSMSGTDEVSVNDFVEFFEEIKLPVNIADSTLKKKVSDSLVVSEAIFNQFIGDTIFAPVYGAEKPKIFAIGRFKNKEEETYLLLRAKGAKAVSYYVAAFTPDNKFSASMLLLSNHPKWNETNRATIDSRYTFNMVDEYKDASGSISEYTTVYGYNNAGLFMVLMTDGLKKGEQMAIINPIDTLPAKNKFSGNYGKDKRNFITIRDGSSPQDFVFYINFDKGNGSDCHAELKGDAKVVSKDSAVYLSPNDPCTIGFKFTGNYIKITESVNCGNKRPADCSFNAYYKKQKIEEPKKEGEKKKEPAKKKK